MGAKIEDLNKLSSPEVVTELGIKLKWYPDSTKYNKATLVSYFDARDVAKILDNVIGASNWSDEYHELKGNLFCRISVTLENGDVIHREDVGTESSYSKEKGEASDAFKRAAAKLGVRFAYENEMKTFNMQGDYIILDEASGYMVHKKDTASLTDFCNGISTQEGLLWRLWNSDTVGKPDVIKSAFTTLKEYYG